MTKTKHKPLTPEFLAKQTFKPLWTKEEALNSTLATQPTGEIQARRMAALILSNDDAGVAKLAEGLNKEDCYQYTYDFLSDYKQAMQAIVDLLEMASLRLLCGIAKTAV